ncbi:MAG: hypothetical protein U5K84_07290 [Alkalibacterium sp.]|nr:hypothetical protein [Alkalibacterium sp.]
MATDRTIGQNFDELTEEDVEETLDQQDADPTPEMPIIEETQNEKGAHPCAQARGVSSSGSTTLVKTVISKPTRLMFHSKPEKPCKIETIEEGPNGESAGPQSPPSIHS